MSKRPRRIARRRAVIALGLFVSLATVLMLFHFEDSSRSPPRSRPAPFRAADPFSGTIRIDRSSPGGGMDGEFGRSVGSTDGDLGPGPGSAATDESFEAGELLVADPPPSFWAEAERLGVHAVETLTLRHLGLNVHRLRATAGVDVDVALARLRQRFFAVPIDYDHYYQLARGSEFPSSYARALIGWTDLPADCGKGVRIGMIDAAVYTAHPAFNGAAVEYRSFHRRDRAPGPADHGTAIAALLVGVPAAGRGWGGLLPGAELTAANIFEVAAKTQPVATARALLESVDWMVERRVQAVNVSLAGPDNRVVRTAVERAAARSLLLVAAAGNGGLAGLPAYPAAYDETLAITAVAADRSIYSHANRGSYVDFAAPGVRVWTAVPQGGRFQSGTSFATPYITALVALAVAQGMDAEVRHARDLLRGEVVDLGPPGHDNTFGWGLVKRKPACPIKAGDVGSLRLGLVG
jgi:subtilisin family serine protease